jgi:hypothetical protein
LVIRPLNSSEFRKTVDFGKLAFSNPAVADEQFTFDQQIFRGGMNFKLN